MMDRGMECCEPRASACGVGLHVMHRRARLPERLHGSVFVAEAREAVVHTEQRRAILKLLARERLEDRGGGGR